MSTSRSENETTLTDRITTSLINREEVKENNHGSNDETASTSPVSYWGMIRHNRSYRLYLISYLLDHLGEWLTYVAAIELIEEFQHDKHETKSRTAVSILVIVRIVPHVCFSTIGGAIADSYDKRHVMMTSAMIGSVIALFYLIVFFHVRSVASIYLVTFLQEFNLAMHEPSRSSIVPLLVSDNDGGEELKKATTLTGLAWSLMAAVGASMGGLVVATFGSCACFVLDSATFLASAFTMWLVGGKWKAVPEADDNGKRKLDSMNSKKNANQSSKAQHRPTVLETLVEMIREGFAYLRESFWGPLVFLKASSATVYGATDVLNVAFSERDGDGDSFGSSSVKLGLLFAISGVGCIVGPLVSEHFNDMKRLRTLQVVAVVSHFIGATGCFGLGLSKSFLSILLLTGLRSSGNSALWINSTLILQTLSVPDKLGRVLAIDYALALFGEALSALVCGALLDHMDFTPEGVAFLIGGLGLVLSFVWLVYDQTGNGCAWDGLAAIVESSMKRGGPKEAKIGIKTPDETTSLL